MKIAAQPKTDGGALERLCFRTRDGVRVIGPFLACRRVQAQTEDHQLTGDEHFRDRLLVVASLEVGASSTAYFRVQPAGLNNELRRSVYAR